MPQVISSACAKLTSPVVPKMSVSPMAARARKRPILMPSTPNWRMRRRVMSSALDPEVPSPNWSWKMTLPVRPASMVVETSAGAASGAIATSSGSVASSSVAVYVPGPDTCDPHPALGVARGAAHLGAGGVGRRSTSSTLDEHPLAVLVLVAQRGLDGLAALGGLRAARGAEETRRRQRPRRGPPALSGALRPHSKRVSPCEGRRRTHGVTRTDFD